MSRTPMSLITLMFTAALLGAWVARSGAAVAHAEEPSKDQARLCRIFKQNLEGTPMYDTSDRTSEIGQWVGEKRTNGWRVADSDFAITPKSNGFPQGYVHVCLAR